MEARSKTTSGLEGRAGSALILAVVLTSLLAIVGVLFMLLSRMDKVSASAGSQDRQLGLAVDAVIAAISDQLVQDAPGAQKGNGQSVGEYYDYPDSNDPWLACLEPESGAGGVYRWTQVSDLTPSAQTRADRSLRAGNIQEHKPITDPHGPADADGDGVKDANWYALDSVRSSKGRPLYAAVRIIDHGAMLNVNTAWDLNPADSNLCDGSHQMQIDLAYLALRGKDNSLSRLSEWRGYSQTNWRSYLTDAIWGFDNPSGSYTPFDVSDELKLRYRYILNLDRVTSRIEKLWTKAFDGGLGTPVAKMGEDLDTWARKVIYHVPTMGIDPNYDFRHISTVYNMDRIIDPNSDPMVNVNTADANSLYSALQKGGIADVDVAAQLAVNIRDFADSNTAPTAFNPPGSAKTYYGMEPQPFIRQIGFRISATNAEDQTKNEFMVELYNPFNTDVDLKEFTLYLINPAGPIDPNGKVVSSAQVDFKEGDRIKAGESLVLDNQKEGSASLWKGNDLQYHENMVLALYEKQPQPQSFRLTQWRDVLLVRNLGKKEIRLDQQKTSNTWFDWNTVIKDTPQYYARANGRWAILYPTMTLAGKDPSTSPKYNLPQPQQIPHSDPTLKGLATIGDIGRIFQIGPHPDPNFATSMVRVLGEQPPPSEEQICLNIQDPNVARVFEYLTVLAPQNFPHMGDDPNETRVKGRINVNTAPAFVIDRLPWLQWAQDQKKVKIGEAIVDYRNQHGAFKGIGDLIKIDELRCMLGFAGQESDGPDLTQDGEPNDIEARDLLFSRISNLVTVRSDVFSAYILVRIGEDGPQRRVLAILDRSSVKTAADRVRVIALQTVPDPR